MRYVFSLAVMFVATMSVDAATLNVHYDFNVVHTPGQPSTSSILIGNFANIEADYGVATNPLVNMSLSPNTVNDQSPFIIQFELTERRRVSNTTITPSRLLASLDVDENNRFSDVVGYGVRESGIYYIAYHPWHDDPGYQASFRTTYVTDHFTQQTISTFGGIEESVQVWDGDSDDERELRYQLVPFWVKEGATLIGSDGKGIGEYWISGEADSGVQVFGTVFVETAGGTLERIDFYDGGGLKPLAAMEARLKSDTQYYLLAGTDIDEAVTEIHLSIFDGPTNAYFGIIPEPSSAAVLGIGISALLCRRRKGNRSA